MTTTIYVFGQWRGPSDTDAGTQIYPFGGWWDGDGGAPPDPPTAPRRRQKPQLIGCGVI